MTTKPQQPKPAQQRAGFACPFIPKDFKAPPCGPDLDLLARISRRLSSLPETSLIPAGVGMGLVALPRVQLRSTSPPILMGQWLALFLARWADHLHRPIRRSGGGDLIRSAFGPYLHHEDLTALLDSGASLTEMLPVVLNRPADWPTFQVAVTHAWAEEALSVAEHAMRTWFAETPLLPEIADATSATDGRLRASFRLADYIVAVCGVCSVPIWTAYCGLHGTATVKDAVPALKHTIDVMLNRLRGLNLIQDGLIRADVPGAVLETLAAMLQDKASSVEQFERWLGGLPPRTPPPSELRGLLAVADPTGEGSEILWAFPEAWAAVRALADLVDDAGFHLWVTAATNEFGGRHPPHQTHNSGREIDLDWGFSANPKDAIPNLRSGTLVALTPDGLDGSDASPALVFSHLKGGQPMGLTPIRGKEGGETTQWGVARLATWVVLQGLPLAGFGRWLYSDAQNMRVSFDHLRAALGLARKETKWLVGQDSSVSVVDPKVHHNHLHAQLRDPARAYLDDDVRKALTKLAKKRDEDDSFWFEMFAESGVRSVDEHLAEVRAAWEARAKAGRNALLPVWVPQLL